MIIAASFDTSDPELWVNRGLAYGDGVFETMRFTGSEIPLIAFHLARLSDSLSRLQLRAFERSHLDHCIANLALDLKPQSAMAAAIIKLMVFRGQQSRTYTPLTPEIDWLITAEPLTVTSSNEALKLALSEQYMATQPLLAGIKHLSRLEQVMLAVDLNQQKGIDDLLFVDAQGRLIETIQQNIVLLQGNQLKTPKLSGSGVEGVALQWLKANHAVTSCHLTVNDLSASDGLLVGNSVRGFRLVESIRLGTNDCISFGTSHRIHDKILAQWEALFKA